MTTFLSDLKIRNLHKYNERSFPGFLSDLKIRSLHKYNEWSFLGFNQTSYKACKLKLVRKHVNTKTKTVSTQCQYKNNIHTMSIQISCNHIQLYLVFGVVVLLILYFRKMTNIILKSLKVLWLNRSELWNGLLVTWILE